LKKLHSRLRRRLERSLGKETVAFGLIEFEPDEARRTWQPHHHLTISNVPGVRLLELRRRHYQQSKSSTRPMLVQDECDTGWYAYMSKQTAFRKLLVVTTDGKEYIQRKRLRRAQTGEFMRFLSQTLPTSLVFAMNCRPLR
jgi:hypothetical protein